MDFTSDSAAMLLAQPKVIFVNDEKIDCITIPSNGGAFYIRYTVLSEDEEYLFLLEISQSQKNHFNMTLHFQEDETKIGLLRIDYGGRHKNPEIANNHVPNAMLPYTGKLFGFNEHHIHYHVEGYQTLAWAIPLKADCFPVKELSDFDSLKDAVISFAGRINLKTTLQIEGRLFL